MNRTKGITKRDYRNLVLGVAIGHLITMSILMIPNKLGWTALAISIILGGLFWERNKAQNGK
jgi:hypothetical protein